MKQNITLQFRFLKSPTHAITMKGPITHPTVLKVIINPIFEPFPPGFEFNATYESRGVALKPFPSLSKTFDKNTVQDPVAKMMTGLAKKDKNVPRRNIGLHFFNLSETTPATNRANCEMASVVDSISPIATKLIPNVSLRKKGVIAYTAVVETAVNRVINPTINISGEVFFNRLKNLVIK